MATIALQGVRKSFGTHPVIHGVSFDLADGEFLALVGPSDCGKSTLLRMIAGLETVSAGTIRIGERVVNDLAPKDRDVAMVFQSYALYPNLTVARNIAQPLRLAGMTRGEIDRRVDEAARVLGLDALLDRYPRALSGGQRQRVAMGRAIVREPDVFLFDEPLSNLDAQLRVQMRAEIKELVQRLGTTTVYVTHDQVEALTMADRVAVMQSGRVEQMGAPLDLYDRPANAFVAAFVGSPAMNLLAGRVVRSQDMVAVVTPGGTRLPLGPGLKLTEGQPVLLGIRPEHLEIRPVSNSLDGLQASVAVVEATGADTLVIVRERDAELRAHLRDRRPVRVGDRVELLLPDAMRLHAFDTQTGLRLDLT